MVLREPCIAQWCIICATSSYCYLSRSARCCLPNREVVSGVPLSTGAQSGEIYVDLHNAEVSERDCES